MIKFEWYEYIVLEIFGSEKDEKRGKIKIFYEFFWLHSWISLSLFVESLRSSPSFFVSVLYLFIHPFLLFSFAFSQFEDYLNVNFSAFFIFFLVTRQVLFITIFFVKRLKKSAHSLFFLGLDYIFKFEQLKIFLLFSWEIKVIYYFHQARSRKR